MQRSRVGTTFSLDNFRIEVLTYLRTHNCGHFKGRFLREVERSFVCARGIWATVSALSSSQEEDLSNLNVAKVHEDEPR